MPNLLFLDSFDHYATADIAKKYATVVSFVRIDSGAGRNGTSAMVLYGDNSGARIALANLSTFVIEFAYRAVNTTSRMICQAMDGSTTQLELYALDTGHLEVRRNGTTVATGTAAMTQTGWTHIGWKATIHGTAGSVETRINGLTDINATGLNTQNTGHAYATAVGPSVALWGNSADLTYDDLILSSDAFSGDCSVQAILPVGAGNYSQWTPSAGSGYQCVDEALMNGDTDYVSSSTPGQRNSYDFAAVSGSAVKGVQHVTTVRTDDAGARTIRQFARISGADYDGAAAGVSSSYAMQRRVMSVSPATGAAWTISELNGAEFGVKLES